MKNRHVFITGPRGFTMEDGLNKHLYFQMRAIVRRKILEFLEEGEVTLISVAFPWSGHIAADLYASMHKEHDGLKLDLRLGAGYNELHTPDHKYGLMKFDDSSDGVRLSDGHAGFHKQTGIPSVLNLSKLQSTGYGTIHSAIYTMYRSCTTVIAFPTKEKVMTSLVNILEDREKDIIKIKSADVTKEAVVSEDKKLGVLRKALKLIEADEFDLMDKLSGYIFIEALEVIKKSKTLAKSQEKPRTFSTTQTKPPPHKSIKDVTR